jgi:iron complex outermembrane receptor protein
MNLLSALRAAPFIALLLSLVASLPQVTLGQGAEHSHTAGTPDLTTIIVSGSALETGLLEYGKPACIVHEHDLHHHLSTTLGETIDHAPGVRSSFAGPGASRPVIRGFSGERVRVMTNGLSTGDVSEISEDHVVTSDPLEARSIEILRGPETLLYGSSAIGGAVNVLKDDIPELFLPRPFQGQVLGTLGDSADQERSAAARFSAELSRTNGAAINLQTSAFYRNTSDYRIPGFAESDTLRAQEAAEHAAEEEQPESGKVRNSATETFGATVGTSYVWNQGFVGVAVSGFDSRYGVPGHAHGHEHEEEEDHEHEETRSLKELPEEGEDSVRIEAQQLRVDVRGRLNDVSDSIDSIKFRTSFTDYEHEEIEGGSVATRFERDSFEGRLEVMHNPIATMRGVFGVQFLYDDFSAIGEEAFLIPTKSFSPALFFFERLPLSDATQFQFGGRVEVTHRDPIEGNSESFVPFSLSAGPVWTFGDESSYSLGLTLAYTERAPSAVELYANGPHLARQIFEVGDSTLGKERAWGIDLALRKTKGTITGAFTPFVQQFTDYINLAGTGDEIDDLPLFTYEHVDALFWGFEAETSLHLGTLMDLNRDALTLDYQIDFLRARDEDSNQDLPRIPPLRNIVRARYAYDKSIEGSVEGVFVSSQNRTAEFELPTNDYALLNAEVGAYVLRQENSSLRAFVRGANLTNEEARVHSSFLKDLAPLRGRAFLLGVSGAF